MSEATDQAALFEWAKWNEARHPALRWLYHPANEANGGGGVVTMTSKSGKVRRVPVEALRNAQMGVKKGVPDLWLPWRVGPWLGWAGELKVKGGALSPEQDAWLMHLQQQGWMTGVYVGWTTAAAAICRYLGIDEKEAGL